MIRQSITERINPVHHMKFMYPWRSYQNRVLRAINDHLSDNRLHIVAAPGSGKTILGIEVFRLLGKPAVVLSPTRIIRDQWIERLKLFTNEKVPQANKWTSADLNSLSFFNSLTYQRLHSESRKGRKTHEESVPDKSRVREVIRAFAGAGISTIILDEAHHLRTAWWDVLHEIVSGLSHATLVCLTATPPYDSSGKEWERYTRLCGPIDEEISIPELVREKNLCPHQDYVYATKLDPLTTKTVSEHKKTVQELFDSLITDSLLQFAVENHRIFATEETPVDEVLSNVAFAVASLAYLKAADKVVPFRLLSLLEMQSAPVMDRELWEALLTQYLFGEGWPEHEYVSDHRKDTAGKLRALKLLYRRKLYLRCVRNQMSRIQKSASKVDAIVRIVEKEWQIKDRDLRQVILCDNIHKEISVEDIKDNRTTLAAWPVFVAITTSLPVDIAQRYVLVTGSFSIVPVTIYGELEKQNALSTSEFTEVDGLSGFYRLTGVSTAYIVTSMTTLLNAGYVNGIVGTTALLGEGWDAPCVNSLILGGYANSYVLTNQSRGRAIRKNPAVSDKVASIWHLLAVDEDVENDILDLSKRFKSFPGISLRDTKIENSLERLDLPSQWNHQTICENNKRMFDLLGNPAQVSECWTNAVVDEKKRLTPVVVDRDPPQVITVHTRLKAGANMIITLFIVLLLMLFWGSLSSNGIWRFALNLLTFLTGVAVITKVYLEVKRFAPRKATVHAMGKALLEALRKTGEIESEETSVEAIQEGSKDVLVYLNGGTYYEKNVFSNCLEEILAPVENPRYIISRKNRNIQTDDYHNVPALFARNKKNAFIFHDSWCTYFKKSQLLYTRTDHAGKIILRARAKACAYKRQPSHELRNRWI